MNSKSKALWASGQPSVYQTHPEKKWNILLCDPKLGPELSVHPKGVFKRSENNKNIIAVSKLSLPSTAPKVSFPIFLALKGMFQSKKSNCLTCVFVTTVHCSFCSSYVFIALAAFVVYYMWAGPSVSCALTLGNTE